jgi:hypothetical protein
MAVRQQQRRGTAAQWTSANPILSPGEIGFEIDTNKFKIGDGTTRWASLIYFTADAAAALEDLIDGAPGLLDTLNELAAAVGDDANFFSTVTTNIATAKSQAISTAAADATTKANTAKSEAISTAASDATTKANNAKSGAETTAATALASHESDTTNIHGIADTSALATKTYADSAVSTAVSGLTKSSVGLANVDNTSDANKPVSSATSTALALKAPLASPTFTGTVSGITKSMVGLGSVDNTADSAKPVSTATQTALDAKLASATAASTYAPLASPTFTGTVSGVTKSHVGLGNVDNTADSAKPVSSAAQTALDLKAPLASPALTGTPTAPTAATGTDTTQVATTAFVKAAIQDISSLNLVLDGGGV